MLSNVMWNVKLEGRQLYSDVTTSSWFPKARLRHKQIQTKLIAFSIKFNIKFMKSAPILSVYDSVIELLSYLKDIDLQFWVI